MKSFKRGDDLEQRLRRSRPEARDEFVQSLATEVRSERRRSRSSAFRIAFAGGLTAAMLAALASVGGLGYAASSAGNAWKAVTGKHAVNQPAQSSAADQYAKKAPVCHNGHVIYVSKNSANYRRDPHLADSPKPGSKCGSGRPRGGVRGVRSGQSPQGTG